ncbi:MAG TPA: carbamoyl-phosphate synthase large subunit [Planctomycetota bacterium]|nr:carbamoyl-phosphate synthase large subunit [Planctomycetota bacterium]
MPRRDDIQSVLIIGSGPIVIGQACEFDYSGTQACKALREEGYRVILVNSNPATIMTDAETADRTYIEPITPEAIEKILAKEKPDALLPTLGGQTGLNTAIKLYESGALERHDVEMIGANYEAIRKGEDRDLFRAAMIRIGLDVPRSGIAHSIEEARSVLADIGLPCVIRPAYTLGGAGGGIAYNVEEFEEIAARGLSLSMKSEVLVEQSIAGWKEFEMEVMRDRADNALIVCSIENFDPMGVHTGDSVTVAPAQTLTDREYQRMRDASLAIIREIGVETGGSNIQFAIDPRTGRMVIIEMNPRVSRSSALASKATGYPIARVAAKLACGYTLDEIPNDITKDTKASFEPTIDYVVVKVPRFAFEKFPGADPVLTTQMKSVGEVMAIGRTFAEAFQKALRGLETGRAGLGLDRKDAFLQGALPPREEIVRKIRTPNEDRVAFIRYAFRTGMTVEEVADASKIDPWFLRPIEDLVAFEQRILAAGERGDAALVEDLLRDAKRRGYSDRQLATAFSKTEPEIRAARRKFGIEPTYKLVDTCAAEFHARTPYYYSTYEEQDEARVSDRKKIVILGGGPNRIGQGIEFDYCCVHAAFAMRELGYESIMVNSNPETVSTDFDTSDLLFFEPLTHEDVLNIVEREKPEGVIVQFGGQTPLNLARSLHDAGAPLIGTSVESIERAEDRELFAKLLKKLKLECPANGIALTKAEARRIAKRLGFPVLVRPSFVLGGRAMRIVYDPEQLDRSLEDAIEAAPDKPILVDKFLEDAIEVDVDCISDGETTVIAGVMEHIEEAGIHSGDSTCAIPPFSLGRSALESIRAASLAMARELEVVGLMNVQLAVKGDRLYVLEVNPRASRTVPYVSKAIGVPLAKLAAKVMVGRKLADLGFTREIVPKHVSVKMPVFPFVKFPGVDTVLGPEMKSTGEVMGIDKEFGLAFAKAAMGAGLKLPKHGRVFLSVKDADKRAILPMASNLVNLGFSLVATDGTYEALRAAGIEAERVNKLHEGRPHILDLLANRDIALVINTPHGRAPRADDARIRSRAVQLGVPVITTLSGFQAAVNGIGALHRRDFDVTALQDWHLSPPRDPASPGSRPPQGAEAASRR